MFLCNLQAHRIWDSVEYIHLDLRREVGKWPDLGYLRCPPVLPLRWDLGSGWNGREGVYKEEA